MLRNREVESVEIGRSREARRGESKGVASVKMIKMRCVCEYHPQATCNRSVLQTYSSKKIKLKKSTSLKYCSGLNDKSAVRSEVLGPSLHGA